MGYLVLKKDTIIFRKSLRRDNFLPCIRLPKLVEWILWKKSVFALIKGLCIALMATGAAGSTVAAVESWISSLADSRSLGALSGGVGLVGGLLGGSQIGQRRLLFVGQSLSVGLSLVGHLSLRRLLSLGGLQRRSGLSGVRLGRLGGGGQRLGLL